MFDINRASSISSIAGSLDTDGNRKMNFVIRHAVNFIANDSEEHPLQVNFDAPVGREGTILLYPGEAMSDLVIQCQELYVQGIGGPVPFRAVGS